MGYTSRQYVLEQSEPYGRDHGAESISITLATNSWSMAGMAVVTRGIITNNTPVPTALIGDDSFPVWSAFMPTNKSS